MMLKIPFRTVRLFGVIAFAVLAVNGCHLAKKTVTTKKPMSEDENVVRKVVQAQADWKFMEIRFTGKAEQDRDRVGFMGTVKIEKDQQVNILLRSTLGIELARAYANRDSVWISSRMLNIKEKGDWQLAAGKIGYPVDFFALQGILTQSLFTSSGNQLVNLIENLVIKNDQENLRLVSNTAGNLEENRNRYLNDFLINRENYNLDDTHIRDINGQWIADVKYLYNKDNEIKKIDLKGIDTDRNFSVEINVVKRETRENIEINFTKF